MVLTVEVPASAEKSLSFLKSGDEKHGGKESIANHITDLQRMRVSIMYKFLSGGIVIIISVDSSSKLEEMALK